MSNYTYFTLIICFKLYFYILYCNKLLYTVWYKIMIYCTIIYYTYLLYFTQVYNNILDMVRFSSFYDGQKYFDTLEGEGGYLLHSSFFKITSPLVRRRCLLVPHTACWLLLKNIIQLIVFLWYMKFSSNYKTNIKIIEIYTIW